MFSSNIHTHTHTHTHIYIYIYIYSDEEEECFREFGILDNLNLKSKHLRIKLL